MISRLKMKNKKNRVLHAFALLLAAESITPSEGIKLIENRMWQNIKELI